MRVPRNSAIYATIGSNGKLPRGKSITFRDGNICWKHAACWEFFFCLLYYYSHVSFHCSTFAPFRILYFLSMVRSWVILKLLKRFTPLLLRTLLYIYYYLLPFFFIDKNTAESPFSAQVYPLIFSSPLCFFVCAHQRISEGVIYFLSLQKGFALPLCKFVYSDCQGNLTSFRKHLHFFFLLHPINHFNTLIRQDRLNRIVCGLWVERFCRIFLSNFN